MHILDGFLPTSIVIGGAVSGAALLAVTVPRLTDQEAPKAAVMTAALFVGSLLSFPLGVTSVHLSLIGLAGVLLGRAAFPAIAVALALQAALLQHGGLTTLGVNATTMGVGALVAAAIFALRGRGVAPRRDAIVAALAAGVGTTVALALYAAALLAAGEAFREVATIAFVLHLPVIAIEAGVAGSAVGYVARVRPRMLGARATTDATPPAAPTPSTETPPPVVEGAAR